MTLDPGMESSRERNHGVELMFPQRLASSKLTNDSLLAVPAQVSSVCRDGAFIHRERGRQGLNSEQKGRKHDAVYLIKR